MQLCSLEAHSDSCHSYQHVIALVACSTMGCLTQAGAKLDQHCQKSRPEEAHPAPEWQRRFDSTDRLPQSAEVCSIRAGEAALERS